jgi:hypothetical protein
VRMGIQGVMGAVAMMAGKAMGLAVIKVDVLMMLTDEGGTATEAREETSMVTEAEAEGKDAELGPIVMARMIMREVGLVSVGETVGSKTSKIRNASGPGTITDAAMVMAMSGTRDHQDTVTEAIRTVQDITVPAQNSGSSKGSGDEGDRGRYDSYGDNDSGSPEKYGDKSNSGWNSGKGDFDGSPTHSSHRAAASKSSSAEKIRLLALDPVLSRHVAGERCLRFDGPVEALSDSIRLFVPPLNLERTCSDISSNAITSLPDGFASLPALTRFDDDITASIPPSLLSSTSIININLANNQLSGTVRNNAPKLDSLSLQHTGLNRFSIQDATSLSKGVSRLEWFRWGPAGSLPDLSSSIGLSALDASYNKSLHAHPSRRFS